MKLYFDGKKSPVRRQGIRGILGKPNDDPHIMSPYFAYRKKTVTYAAKVHAPFEVATLEGVHKGKTGDFLAIGAQGEMYPIDADIFEETYEKVDEE